MKRIPLEYAILAVAVAATAAIALPARAQGTTKAADAAADKLARGKYLVTTSGCNDCHTPWIVGPKGPEPDMSRMLSVTPKGWRCLRPPSRRVRGSFPPPRRTPRGPVRGA